MTFCISLPLRHLLKLDAQLCCAGARNVGQGSGIISECPGGNHGKWSVDPKWLKVTKTNWQTAQTQITPCDWQTTHLPLQDKITCDCRALSRFGDGGDNINSFKIIQCRCFTS